MCDKEETFTIRSDGKQMVIVQLLIVLLKRQEIIGRYVKILPIARGDGKGFSLEVFNLKLKLSDPLWS